MFTKLFWKDAAERSISTAAQASLLVITLSDNGVGVISQHADFKLIALTFFGGGLLSLLKALAAFNVKTTKSASFTVGSKEV